MIWFKLKRSNSASTKLRRGFSLIELIFSMLIIALVFLVVPKILFVSTKSMQLQIKEDGLYDAISLMGQILKVAWDQETIDHNGSILAASEINCTLGKPRNDGNNSLLGQRSCTQAPPDETADGGCDDLDDFRDGSCHSSASGGRIGYDLNISVTMDESNSSKELNATVSTSSAKVGRAFKKSFSYRSYNIGWARIERKWVGE